MIFSLSLFHTWERILVSPPFPHCLFFGGGDGYGIFGVWFGFFLFGFVWVLLVGVFFLLFVGWVFVVGLFVCYLVLFFKYSSIPSIPK